MALLQQRLCHSSKFSSALIKEKGNQGFISILMLPLTFLMIMMFMGIASFSMGIKNITKAQSHCIRINIQGQNELKLLLSKLLKMNKKVRGLHKTRKTLEAKILAASALGQVGVVGALKKILEPIKVAQSALILRQKYLLFKSRIVKRKSLQKLKAKLKTMKAFSIKEESFFKKSLAVKKEKIGDRAYIYKPVPDFSNRQKIRFSWKIRIFSPWNKPWRRALGVDIQRPSAYSCTTSLKKKGEIWISHLYH